MKISVSMLYSYLYCSRKLFLEKVLAIKEPPKESIVLGSLRHEIYDSINHMEEKIVSSIIKKMEHADLISAYKNAYLKILREKIINNKPKLNAVNLDLVDVFKKTWPFILYEAEARSKNIFSFIQQYDVYGSELWEKLTPKIMSELAVESEKLQLKGIIDRLEVYEKYYVPVELKTGKMPREGVWDGHRVQIAAYAMIVEEKFNVDVKEGFVYYLDAGETRHIAINPFMKEEILHLIKKVQDLLAEKQQLPDHCENRNKCSNCGLREACYSDSQLNTLLL